MKSFYSVAIAASLFGAIAAPGHAQTVIDFENVDTTYAPFGGLIADGDYVTQNGYYVQGQDPFNGGGLVGSLIDGADAGTCLDGVCPAGNMTNYYGALNGSVVHFGKLDESVSSLTSFDAAFLASADAAATPLPAFLAIEGDLADGSYAVGYFALGAVGAGGTTAFHTYQLSDAQMLTGTISTLTSGNVTNWYAYAYYCGTNGCTAFEGNEGQFALDNLMFQDGNVAAPAPEAATWAMMLAGFGLVGGAMRNRRTAAVRSS